MSSKSKVKFYLIAILLIIFLGFFGVRFFFFDISNREGRIKIISSPSASIFIDNKAIGKSTPFEEKIKPGEYLIKLIPEGEATSTASWQDKVHVYNNSLTYVNRELGFSDITSSGEILTSTPMKEKPKKKNSGELYIETDPTGAIIKFDNDEKGFAPLLMTDVLNGSHELSVLLPGFFPKTEKINIDTGYRVNAFFKLAVDQSQKTQKENKASDSADIENTAVKQKIEVSDTEVGYLRVRKDANIYSEEVFRVNPKDVFEVIEEKSGWYKIEYEKDKQGWVSSLYVTKVE